MTTALAVPPLAPPVIDAAIVERVLIHGDLRQLSPSQKVSYYKSVCDAVGLNPMTQPFSYLVLNNKEVLYAKRECTEQLRFIHSVSIDPKNFVREVIEGIYVVTAPASLPSGRTDVSTGAVAIDGLKGEARANAMMKAETKAKRRVTLSICGLGMLDETEIDSIPNVTYSVEAPVAAPTAPLETSGVQPSVPNGGDSGQRTVVPDDLPPGAVLILKVDGASGKAKGFLKHSGQHPADDGLPIYDEARVTLAAELCQARTPVMLELKTPPSGKTYVNKISSVKPAPTDAELDAEIARREMAARASEVA